MIDAAILFSFLFLIVILLFVKTSQFQFFKVSIPFFASENAALSIYKYKPKIHLIDLLLGFFFLLQLSLLLYLMRIRVTIFNLNPYIQILVILGSMLLAFVMKYFLYLSIRPLLPTRQVVSYYGFNYAYLCFYSGMVLFLYNLVIVTNQFPVPIWYSVILLGLFYVFLVVRLISISLRYGLIQSIYIFLYFCALEIAPLVMIFIGFMRYKGT